MALQIKTTKSLLTDLEEIQERLGNVRKINNLEEIEEKSDRLDIFSLIYRSFVYMIKSFSKKRKLLIFVISLLCFMILKGKIKSGIISLISSMI